VCVCVCVYPTHTHTQSMNLTLLLSYSYNSTLYHRFLDRPNNFLITSSLEPILKINASTILSYSGDGARADKQAELTTENQCRHFVYFERMKQTLA